MTDGGGLPLILQSKRAARPSSTSTSSSSRVNRGASEGRTVSRALQVSSSSGEGSALWQGRPRSPRHPQPEGPTRIPGRDGDLRSELGMNTAQQGPQTLE